VSADSQQFLYLTTKGWKSGKPHEIEIWFVPHNGKYYLVSEHRGRSHWVQNIKNEPKVSFRVANATYKGEGRLVDGEKERKLAGEVSSLMNKKYKWSFGLIIELTLSG
jgi:deazaflavin-dependent oxidoreductase (nitroreductase family)